MMPILKWELKRRKASMIWWTAGIAALIGLNILSYIAIKDHISELNASLDGLTDSAGAFFGGNDFFSPVGYLSSQIYFILLPLLLIIMVLTLASSLMNDENDKTVELTLARPITRRRLVLTKALAGLIIFATTCILTYFVAVICVKIAGLDISQANLLLTHLLTFAFSLSFGMISFALIALSRATRRLAGVMAIVASFGGYIISSLSGNVSWLEGPAKFAPYHYFDTTKLLNGDIDPGLIVYLAGVLIVTVLVTAIFYPRRDIG